MIPRINPKHDSWRVNMSSSFPSLTGDSPAGASARTGEAGPGLAEDQRQHVGEAVLHGLRIVENRNAKMIRFPWSEYHVDFLPVLDGVRPRVEGPGHLQGPDPTAPPPDPADARLSPRGLLEE